MAGMDIAVSSLCPGSAAYLVKRIGPGAAEGA